jgi:hypothetical protein
LYFAFLIYFHSQQIRQLLLEMPRLARNFPEITDLFPTDLNSAFWSVNELLCASLREKMKEAGSGVGDVVTAPDGAHFRFLFDIYGDLILFCF